jgi:hypothetical protein
LFNSACADGGGGKELDADLRVLKQQYTGCHRKGDGSIERAPPPLLLLLQIDEYEQRFGRDASCRLRKMAECPSLRSLVAAKAIFSIEYI